MNLENIMLSEMSHKRHIFIVCFNLYEMSKIGKSIQTEGTLMFA